MANSGKVAGSYEASGVDYDGLANTEYEFGGGPTVSKIKDALDNVYRAVNYNISVGNVTNAGTGTYGVTTYATGAEVTAGVISDRAVSPATLKIETDALDSYDAFLLGLIQSNDSDIASLQSQISANDADISAIHSFNASIQAQVNAIQSPQSYSSTQTAEPSQIVGTIVTYNTTIGITVGYGNGSGTVNTTYRLSKVKTTVGWRSLNWYSVGNGVAGAVTYHY